MTLKDLEKRLEKEPDNLPLRVTVAGMMSDAGRKADAVEHYRRVALAYRAQGRLQQALAVARSILELAPNDTAIKTLVAELTEVKTPAPTLTPPPAAPRHEERKPSAAEPTKTGVRGMPEQRAAVAMPVPAPELDDLDTKPPGATGSRPPGVLPQRITNTGLRAIPGTPSTKGPKSTPPVIRIPDKKGDSQPPASATFRSQPPPPPRRSPFPDDVTDPHISGGAPRRSSFDTPTPLPQPVPYHLADPTSSQDRISRDNIPGLGLGLDEALETRPGDKPNEERDSDSGGGLAQAARRISSLIKPRAEKPTRNPFTPDPTLRPDAPPQPAPARMPKPALDPYADKPIIPRSDKPTRQPPLGRDKPGEGPARSFAAGNAKVDDKSTQQPPLGRPDKSTQQPPLARPDKSTQQPPLPDRLPSIARPAQPGEPSIGRPASPAPGEPSIARPAARPASPVPGAPSLGKPASPTPGPLPGALGPPLPRTRTPSAIEPLPRTRTPSAIDPSKVPLRPEPAPTLPARTPPVTSTSKTQPRPAQPPPHDDTLETQPMAGQPSSRLGDTFRAQPPPAGPPPMLPVSSPLLRPTEDLDEGRPTPNLPVARPPLRPSDKGPSTMKAQPPPIARPRPSVPQPARDTGSSGVRAVPRPARDTGSAGVTGTHRALPVTGAQRPIRDTGSPETRVDNLPPAPEPGADQLPPPPAVPPRAASPIPRTPSYSDEIVAELDTRERPRLSSDDIDKIAAPPPTVPTEQIVLDDDQVTPPPQMQWNERRARAGGPPIRDTPMDPPTDVHTSIGHGGAKGGAKGDARDTSLDMHTEAGTDVQGMGQGMGQGTVRDTRRDAVAEPTEEDRTAPRELVAPEPLANAFFLPIPLNRREAALTRCIKRVVRPGQTVIRQGETSHPLYLVVSGQLELRVERANGTLGKLDEIDAGQYIGEGSLLARSPAIAHVIASATCELLALPPHALFELAGAYPALWAALKDSAERRARAYEKLLRG